MKRIAIIGAGISGLSIAQCLHKIFEVKVFEQSSEIGGLVKCKNLDGNLYHVVGGHVFNSKNKYILKWFWNFFDQEKEFISTRRNSVISLGNKIIGYPIENHIYQMDEEIIFAIIDDLLKLGVNDKKNTTNFEDFLLNRFGKTLYNLYFRPYNEKIWRGKNLSEVPLSWLSGKLPMPDLKNIIFNNFVHRKEFEMVHSTFYYPRINGSQFIADRLAQGLDIECCSKINKIIRNDKYWLVNEYECDHIIFSGNLKDLPQIFKGSLDLGVFNREIENLEYHGTTSVLCEIDCNPYSWVYMPGKEHKSHRIICTGNFSPTNNSGTINTGTIEFTDYVSTNEILSNLSYIPLNPQYITHEYTKYTYPIQNKYTRDMIQHLKKTMQNQGVSLLGRFAEWEYYNMDAAMEAALSLEKVLIHKYN